MCKLFLCMYMYNYLFNINKYLVIICTWIKIKCVIYSCPKTNFIHLNYFVLTQFILSFPLFPPTQVEILPTPLFLCVVCLFASPYTYYLQLLKAHLRIIHIFSVCIARRTLLSMYLHYYPFNCYKYLTIYTWTWTFFYLIYFIEKISFL